MFEKSLREKVSRENNGVRWELGQLQQQLEVRSGDSWLSKFSRNPSMHLQQWTEERNPGWVLCPRQLPTLFPACLHDTMEADRQITLCSLSSDHRQRVPGASWEVLRLSKK